MNKINPLFYEIGIPIAVISGLVGIYFFNKTNKNVVETVVETVDEQIKRLKGELNNDPYNKEIINQLHELQEVGGKRRSTKRKNTKRLNKTNKTNKTK